MTCITTEQPGSPVDSRRRRRAVGAVRVGWLVAIVVVVVALVGGATMMSRSDSSEANAPRSSSGQIDWYTVDHRSFDLTVTESGDLDAAKRLEIKSRVEGRPIILKLVEEGVEVKEGDVLVELDADELRGKIEEAILAVEKARADAVFARRQIEIQKSEAAAGQAEAEVAVDLAKLELAKWKKGDVPQMRRELKLAYETAKRQVERTKRDYEISQQLYAKKFLSLNDLEDDEIALLEAEDALATAELNVSVYDEYTFRTEEQTKTSDLNKAQSQLERQVATDESEIAKLEADLSSKTQSLKIREEGLANLQEQLANSIICAPQDGMVVYASSVGNHRWRGDPMAEGRQVRYNESIIYLPDTAQMVANLAVAEAYEPVVKVGQKVRVTVDARPGQTYEGVIEKTTPLSESGGWLNPGQREFTARVILPPGIDPTLKPAMRCTGEIYIGRVEDTLAVPVQCVFAEGDEYFCYVPASGGYVERRSVKIGRASESMVEILDGLTSNTRVLLRNPMPGELRQSNQAS